MVKYHKGRNTAHHDIYYYLEFLRTSNLIVNVVDQVGLVPSIWSSLWIKQLVDW